MPVSEQSRDPVSTPAGDGDAERGQRPASRPWWIAAGLLAALCLGLFAYLMLRTAPVIEKVLEAPIATEDKDTARVTRLKDVIAVRREQLSRSIARIEAPRCEAPKELDAGRLALLHRDMAGELDQWRALIDPPMSRIRNSTSPPPPAPGTNLDPASPVPQAEESQHIPSKEGQGAGSKAQPYRIGALRDRLEKGTVLVLAIPPKGQEGLSTGTGFFISDSLIVTNRHVIEPGDPSTLFVTSAALGSLAHVTLLARSAQITPGKPDFAVLRIEGAKAPAVLPLAGEKTKLSPVIAAGFPGMSLLQDGGFRSLLQGDLSSAPDLNMNRGEIRSIRSVGPMTQIIHTADVLKGYSGGPLLDSCGRAIGINTLIQVDKDQASKLNAAQTVDTLVTFLKQNGLSQSTDDRRCDISQIQ
ncbi:S1 family peptidase [Rhodospirillum sp. A1_3_36]|uniref:S1 family peptidase n=1 Tax=Rhodospirillum sp. A1_3_36 TaxID=3391666 RepID=UPI0039A45B1E